jgi:hypothetical protein
MLDINPGQQGVYSRTQPHNLGAGRTARTQTPELPCATERRHARGLHVVDNVVSHNKLPSLFEEHQRRLLHE